MFSAIAVVSFPVFEALLAHFSSRHTLKPHPHFDFPHIAVAFPYRVVFFGGSRAQTYGYGIYQTIRLYLETGNCGDPETASTGEGNTFPRFLRPSTAWPGSDQ